MMRPGMGPGGPEFNGQMYPGNPGQPHPGMRNYVPMNNSNDPYTVNNRFGAPNPGNPGGPGGPGPVVGPGGPVCQQPMYSPNNPGDSMHALRGMSAANFPVTPDSNPGYNGYGNPTGPGPQPAGPPDFNGPPQQGQPNGYNRMRPNFNTAPNMMPNMMHGPRVTNMPPVGPAGPAGQMCHNGNMVEMQQPFNQQPPQQQQQQQQQLPLQQPQAPMGPSSGGGSFMDQHGGSGFNNNNAVLNNENFNEFNQLMQPGQNGQPPHGQPQHMDHPDQSWRNRATDIRQSLLNKLKEALTSQNYPNAGSMAETYENEAFVSANNLKEYQIKLVNWLASIYDSSSNSTNMSLGDLKSPMLPGGINMGGMMNPAGGMMPAAGDNTNSPPDSSTNGLTDVSSTSPKVHDQNSCNNDLVESSGNGTSGGGSATSVSTNPTNAGGKPVTADDLMLATPKSERSLSPTSLSPCTSAVNSPMATTVSTAASSVGSASTTLTSKASSPATSTSSSTTFQCPPPAMPPIESIGILETKTASTQQRTPNSISQQSVQPPPTNGTQRGKCVL